MTVKGERAARSVSRRGFLTDELTHTKVESWTNAERELRVGVVRTEHLAQRSHTISHNRAAVAGGCKWGPNTPFADRT